MRQQSSVLPPTSVEQWHGLRNAKDLVHSIDTGVSTQKEQVYRLGHPPSGMEFANLKDMSFHTPPEGRTGFTIMEMVLVIVVIGLLATLAAPAFYRSVARSKVNQASGVLASDFEQAVALATRMRRPIRLSLESAKVYTLRDRASSPADTLRLRRTIALSGTQGVEGLSFSRSTVDIFPNGTTDGALTATITGGGLTKSVSLSSAGMVRKN